MKTFLTRIFSIFRLASRRLWAQRGLAAAMTLGLTIAVGLAMSVPLYADAVHFRILRETLLGEGSQTPGLPLSFRFRYTGARDGKLNWEDAQALNVYLSGPAFDTLHMGLVRSVRHFKTDIHRTYRPGDDPKTAKSLLYLSFGAVSDPEANIVLREGSFPTSSAAANAPIEVLIYEDIGTKFGWAVGDEYILRRGSDIAFPVRVVGFWAPANPYDKFWSAPLEELALVSEETFASRIAPAVGDELYLGIWQIHADGSRLHAHEVEPLLGRIAQLEKESAANLAKVKMDDSPVEELKKYQKGVPELTFLLFAFSVPLIALLLAFIGLVVGLYVDQQRNQIAVLRSRGATKAQVTGIALIEGLILGGMALLLGIFVGLALAGLVGRARSFLNFTAPPDLRLGLTPLTWAAGGAAILLALAAMLLPTIGAAGHTILTYKQERARNLCPPWWQRLWLDLLLLIPTGYGFYQLSKTGNLALQSGAAVNDIFQNPLLFLTPALGLFALTLFLARLLPLVMSVIAWLAARSDSVGLLLASRQLARAPGMFTAPLMLLTLTLSLSAFTASLAQTFDGHLTKQTYYKVGADLRLEEMGLSTGVAVGQRWRFKPVENHLQIPGVTAVTRLGRYTATVPFSPPVGGVFFGVDRLTFPQVATWQRDFGPTSLGALMNSLAQTPNGVLVSRRFLAMQNLKVGDPLKVLITAFDETNALEMVIVGTFDLFPTWYPSDGDLFVGNLDTFYQTVGVEYPYEVWLKTAPDADTRRITWTVKGMTAYLDFNADPTQVVEDGLNIVVSDWHSAPLTVFAEQRRPQRQGLFGLLSVGFVASALLTVLGFMLYALFSFRRRFVELGVLRAVGLSTVQMTVLLAWELAALILVGMAAGTGLGVWVSAWFIPFLQLGSDPSTHYPPFLVTIAWSDITRIYLVFGLLFLGALAGLTALLLRMKIFQAVKLGETT